MQIQISNYRLKIYFSKLEKRTGICSRSFNDLDKHCLLWDFDNADLKDIKLTLIGLQFIYHLPDIFIIKSSLSKYHAYCFASRSFLDVINILSATPQIDMDYLRLGVVRGYFTLRISERNGEKFELVDILKNNNYSDEISPLDITVNEYLTSNKGGKHNV